MDAQDHRVRPAPHRRSGRAGLHRAGQDPAEELDRPLHRRGGHLPGHHRRRHRGLHHPAGHPLWHHLYGALPRARAGAQVAGGGRAEERRRGHRLPEGRRLQVRPGAHGAEQGEDRRAPGRRAGRQPSQRQGDPHLHLRLRALHLWHRRHHGRARPRRPGLGVRQEVRLRDHRGGLRRRGRAAGRLYRQGRHRHPGQLRLPQRQDREGRHPRHDPVAGGEGHRRGQGQLQAARLGLLPSAVLGRPHPHGVLREVRLAAPARGAAPPAAARGGLLRAHRRRRVPPEQDDRLGEHHLPLLRRPRQAGDRHHAPVGGLLLVLPALYGPPQRESPGLQRGPGLLEPRGLVQRRHGAHHPAPALLPLLAQVPVRHRRGAHQGALQKAYLPRHDPGRGRREDVQEPRQRHQPQRRGGPVRRGHHAAVYHVHRRL